MNKPKIAMIGIGALFYQNRGPKVWVSSQGSSIPLGEINE